MGTIIWIYVKKYWQIALTITVIGAVLIILEVWRRLVANSAKAQFKLDQESIKTASKALLEIRERLNEATMESQVELKVAKENSDEKKQQLSEARKLKKTDRMAYRRKLAEMLLLFMLVISACSTQQPTVSYQSAFPTPIDVSGFIKDMNTNSSVVIKIPDCTPEDMWTQPLPEGTLFSVDENGHKMEVYVQGGILVSDCKIEELIEYKRLAELYYQQRNALTIAYQATYQASIQTEKVLQQRIAGLEGEKTKYQQVWEENDCGVCFSAGVGLGGFMGFKYTEALKGLE